MTEATVAERVSDETKSAIKELLEVWLEVSVVLWDPDHPALVSEEAALGTAMISLVRTLRPIHRTRRWLPMLARLDEAELRLIEAQHETPVLGIRVELGSVLEVCLAALSTLATAEEADWAAREFYAEIRRRVYDSLPPPHTRKNVTLRRRVDEVVARLNDSIWPPTLTG